MLVFGSVSQPSLLNIDKHDVSHIPSLAIQLSGREDLTRPLSQKGVDGLRH